jgi:hypothetical protein
MFFFDHRLFYLCGLYQFPCCIGGALCSLWRLILGVWGLCTSYKGRKLEPRLFVVSMYDIGTIVGNAVMQRRTSVTGTRQIVSNGRHLGRPIMTNQLLTPSPQNCARNESSMWQLVKPSHPES